MHTTETHVRRGRGNVVPFRTSAGNDPITIVPPNARPSDRLIFFRVTADEPNGFEPGDILIARGNYDRAEIIGETLCLINSDGQIIARRPRDFESRKPKAVSKLPPPPAQTV